MTVDAAYNYCSEMARSHYENFPVGRLVPPALAPHVHAVYAFARHSDDLADEGYAEEHDFGDGRLRKPTIEERLVALDDWEKQLRSPQDPNRHPIFVALHETIRTFDLPLSLFTDLLSAFKQDVVKTRYEDFPTVLDYCRRSANPIGRLVLLLHGHRRDDQMVASDAICTALQLANFWQDVSVDLLKDRIYIPLNEMAVSGIHESSLFEGNSTGAWRGLMASLVARTEALFQNGYRLIHTLPQPLRSEIFFTWHGGRMILQKIADQGYDTLHVRPKISKYSLPALAVHVLFDLRS